MHRFEATKDGQLAHYTDDQLRATIPPAGWADYAEQWPNAKPVIDQLTRSKAPEPAQLAAPAPAAQPAAAPAVEVIPAAKFEQPAFNPWAGR